MRFMTVAELWAWVSANPTTAITGAVVALVAVLVVRRLVAAAVRRRRMAVAARPPALGLPERPISRRIPGARVDMAVTMLVAGLATAVSATGMWRFFGDVLGVDGPARVALFGFIEAALFVSALRSRRHRLWVQQTRAKLTREVDTDADKTRAKLAELDRAVDADGIAVWILASLTGVLSALDAHSVGEVAFRLVAPLIAAWLWERGMAAEARAVSGRPAKTRRTWAVSPRRILVALHILDATDRDVTQIDAARRVNVLVRRLYRLHSLPSNAKPAMREKRQTAVRKAVLAATARGLLATDTDRADVRTRLALLLQVEAATTPAALADLSPWTGHTPDVPADTTPDTRPDTAPDVPADTPTVATTDTVSDTPADRKRTPARTVKARTATADKVLKIAHRNPGLSTEDIANRVGVTDRTVRRHLANARVNGHDA